MTVFQADGSRGAHQSKMGGLSRLRLSSKKPSVPATRSTAVPEPTGRLALRSRRDHGAEEGDPSQVDDRGADVVADRVHSLVVGLSHGIVELGRVRRGREVGRQPDLFERLDNDARVLPALLEVDPVAQGCVERQEHLWTFGLFGCDAHPHGAHGFLHEVPVALGKVVLTLVEDGQGHHVPAGPNITDLLHLEHPAGRDPRRQTHHTGRGLGANNPEVTTRK